MSVAIRLSTNLTEQISRKFPGQERFQEKSGLLCTTTFNGACLPGTVFVLADTYRAGMLTPEIIVILFTRYCLSDLVPSFMTGNQCGRSSYTKISRRTIKFKEISRISRSCRHPGDILLSSWCLLWTCLFTRNTKVQERINIHTYIQTHEMANINSKNVIKSQHIP